MDVLKMIKNLEDNLFQKYGNPLETYKQTQDDVHMTYYVGRLMEELGHKWIRPENIKGEHEDRAHYSENALHDAFLAGRLIERANREEMIKNLMGDVKHELINYLERNY